MRKTLLTALGSAALLSCAVLGSPAGAMTFAAPSAIGIAATDTGLVQKAAVRARYYHHRYYNYYGYGQPYGYYGRPYGYYGGPFIGVPVPFIGFGW